jgi:chromosome condensin MukBEF MukE localization factor
MGSNFLWQYYKNVEYMHVKNVYKQFLYLHMYATKIIIKNVFVNLDIAKTKQLQYLSPIYCHQAAKGPVTLNVLLKSK